MGSVLGTAGLSVVATAAFVVAAILTMIADSRLRGIDSYDTDEDLQDAHSDLLIGYILAWVAAGITFFLMLGYIFKSFASWLPEWIHMILLVLAIIAAIIALIFMGLGMRKIDNTPNDDSTHGYLLWSMILTGVGLVFLVILGMWRITHWGTEISPEEDETMNGDGTGTGAYDPYGYQQQGTTVVVGGGGMPPAARPPPPSQVPRRPPRKM